MNETPQSIFRKESLKTLNRSIGGDVILGAPPSWQKVIYIFTALIASVVIFLLQSTYTRKETVQGWLVPEGGFIRVVARESGTITKLNVKEGDDVVMGSNLANMKLSQNNRGDVGVHMESEAKTELNAHQKGLGASLARLEIEKTLISQRLNNLKLERIELIEQNKLNLSKERLVKEDYARVENLIVKGFITSRDLDIKKSEMLSVKQLLAQGRTALISIERQINEAESNLRLLPIRIIELRSQGDAQISMLNQKITQLSATSSSDIIAPITGKVSVIPVNVGQTMSAGGVVTILTPSTSKLITELFVPSKAIGFIDVGQAVMIRYQAFPYEKFGVGKGKIISISHTLMSATDIPTSGVEVKEPVFRVKVAMDSQAIAAYGKKIPLQPGMLLSAQIELDRRSLREWLFDPIYALGNRL